MQNPTLADYDRHFARLRAKHRAALFTLLALEHVVLLLYSSGHTWIMPAVTAYRYCEAYDLVWDNSARRWKGKCNRVT